MISRFCCYIDKVFDFGDRVKGFMIHVRSQGSRPQRFGAVPSSCLPCAGGASMPSNPNYVSQAIGWPCGSSQAKRRPNRGCLLSDPPEELRAMLFGSIINWVAIRCLTKQGRGGLSRSMDMSFFPSRSRCCKACSQRKVEVHGREEIEYYHRGWSVI